jgi:hypothetical protein
MTQFTYMAIKVANEFQFNQVAERLRGMGYYEDADPTFSEWHHDVFECNFDYHILTYKDGEFSIHHHKGGDYRTYFSFEQFMQNHDDSDLVATAPTTVLGWLELLPDGYRERAIGQYDEKFVAKEIATWGQPEKMQDAIRNFALWEKTIERGDFWYGVHEHYRSGTPLPELPTEQ